MAYRHKGVITKLMEEDGLTQEVAEQAFEAMLNFFVEFREKKQKIIPSPMADKAWHHLILHTKDYAEFCHSHFGHFLHHQPMTVAENCVGSKCRACGQGCYPAQGDPIETPMALFDAPLEALAVTRRNWKRDSSPW